MINDIRPDASLIETFKLLHRRYSNVQTSNKQALLYSTDVQCKPFDQSFVRVLGLFGVRVDFSILFPCILSAPSYVLYSVCSSVHCVAIFAFVRIIPSGFVFLFSLLFSGPHQYFVYLFLAPIYQPCDLISD